MKRKAWEKRIKDATIEAGTYRPFFDAVIETLAGILERRDEAEALYKLGGGQMVVEHTNKGGATNKEKNPALVILNDLNRDALQYWRDLGLTPSGLKKINEQAMVKPKRSALAEALKELGG